MAGCTFSASAFGALYKHVDDAGTVTYSDRPQWPRQQALQLPPPNVATPEARRQLEIARQAFEREERQEYEARIRRAAAVQRSAQAEYSRPLSPSAPRYAGTTYLPYAYPSFTTFTAVSRPSGVSQRAQHARR